MGTFVARYVMTRLVDDIDGSDAVTTVSFSLDGRNYEIDLSESHLERLQQALEPYLNAARTVSGGRRRRRSPATRRTAPKPRLTREVIKREPPAERPAPAEAPAAGAPTTAQPFQEPEPSRPRKRKAAAPLVADPFNPQL
mgnify:CR=1 FL=1|jgi:hypothetical protein